MTKKLTCTLENKDPYPEVLKGDSPSPNFQWGSGCDAAAASQRKRLHL